MTMSMIAWRMVEPNRPLERAELPLPEPGPGEVRVRIAGCGICHTDLGFLHGGVRTRAPLPLALGHEISGMVEACGEGAAELAGKAVIVPAVMPCGQCDPCRRGMGNICAQQKMPGNDIQGGFATHVLVPSAGLCPVDVSGPGVPVGASGVSLAELAVVADAMTTPYQAVLDSGLGPDDVAIFVGVGGVGGFGAQIAKARGAAVVAVDVDPAKLEAVAPSVDAALDARMNPKELKGRITEIARARGKRTTEWKIFETSGTAPGQNTAFGLLVHGASLAVVGFTMDKVELRLSNLMAFHATARGTWGCIPAHYPGAVELVTAGKVRIAPFVETWPLEQVNDVLERAHRHELKKRPVLIP